MTHYFFSPHPDDAALSCGGQIATLASQGEAVMVVTIMADDPDPALQPSLFVKELWTRWGLGTGVAATVGRRMEDREAVSTLGAMGEFWLSWPDAVYRFDPITKEPIYPDVNAIFGDIPPNDPLVTEFKRIDNYSILKFKQRLMEGGTIHCPLGVGGHVDHLLVRQLAHAIRYDKGEGLDANKMDVVYYEEYPYSAPDYKGSSTAAVVQKALDQVATAILEYNHLVVSPVATIHPLDSAALDAKIAAINCYHSQISSFWPHSEAMADSVRRYTKQVGGEREWRFIRPNDHSATSTVS